jgi:CheY-like chemotaxis protein
MLRECRHPGCGLLTFGDLCVDHEDVVPRGLRSPSNAGRRRHPVAQRLMSAPNGKRILHIEDDRLAAALVGALLDEAGYELEWVSTAHAAVAAAQTRDFDLFLLDLGLPDVHGIDVADALARVAPNTPVIIVSGDPEDSPEGMPIVVKPFDGQELVLAVERELAAQPTVANA